jgi:redox-sensitive bicupin YhaK (pirin superfamily)
MGNSVLHTSGSRGTSNYGWLHSRHRFSFGNYYDVDRIHFGALRVLNDDMVAPGKGFGTHPHSNMEIISIPLEGGLEHKDSMNNVSTIQSGEIQVMSAGTGVYHSEYNSDKENTSRFLQIWIYPNKQNVEPRYDQRSIDPTLRINQFHQIVSPQKTDDGVWIHQNAWIFTSKFDAGFELNYDLKMPESNGIYIFVLSGELEVNEQGLKSRDGYGLWEINSIQIKAMTDAEFLLIEVPMKIGAV